MATFKLSGNFYKSESEQSLSSKAVHNRISINDTASGAYEEITLSSNEHISVGDVRKYKNKIIKFQAELHCEGALKFESCILYYTIGTSNIILGDRALITIDGCDIEGIDDNNSGESAFIEAQSGALVNFTNCCFKSCALFIHGDGVAINKCAIIDPMKKFINCGFLKISHCEFLLHTNREGFIISCRELYFLNCEVKGFIKNKGKTPELIRIFTSKPKVKIKNSRFFNIENILFFISCKVSVNNSYFWNCGIFDPILDYELEVSDSVFEKCRGIALYTNKRSNFSHCRFIDCTESPS